MEMTSIPPLVSVVVIGRNEAPRLEQCLRSIRDMANPGGRTETIYVDSASSDCSVEVADRLGVRVINVQSSRPTAALGRNAGWRASSGSYILFLDGDTILDPNFVADSLADFEPDTAIVFGNRREIHPEASIYNRVLDLDWISPAGIADYCGGDALVRREALEAVCGYDEALIAGEEPEMCRRMRGLGWTILHVDRAMTGHDLAMTDSMVPVLAAGRAYRLRLCASVGALSRLQVTVMAGPGAAQSQPCLHAGRISPSFVPPFADISHPMAGLSDAGVFHRTFRAYSH